MTSKDGLNGYPADGSLYNGEIVGWGTPPSREDCREVIAATQPVKYGMGDGLPPGMNGLLGVKRGFYSCVRLTLVQNKTWRTTQREGNNVRFRLKDSPYGVPGEVLAGPDGWWFYPDGGGHL